MPTPPHRAKEAEATSWVRDIVRLPMGIANISIQGDNNKWEWVRECG